MRHTFLRQQLLHSIVRHRLAAGSIDPERQAATVYLAQLAPSSARTTGYVLDRVARGLTDGLCDRRTLSWAALTYADCQQLRNRLRERQRPKTVNLYMSVVRGVLRVAWELGQLDGDSYLRLARSLKPVRFSRLPAGRILDVGEIHTLWRAARADGSAIAMRAGALLGVLYGAGLRIDEARRLVLRDCADEAGVGQLRVRGKGDRERFAYVAPVPWQWVQRWLEMRGPSPGPLLCAIPHEAAGSRARRQIILRAEIQPGRGVGTVPLRRSLRALACMAGVAPFTPHDLRRSFATHLHHAGEALADVQALLGHASIASTSLYLRTDESRKRKAVTKLLEGDNDIGRRERN